MLRLEAMIVSEMTYLDDKGGTGADLAEKPELATNITY